MTNSKNTIYMFIQLFFWMIYCSCYGFASYYLVEKGFGTSIVGIVTAIAGIISAIGQPIIGSLADKASIGYKKPLLVSLMTLSISGLLLLVVSILNISSLICLLYGLIMLILGLCTPLINAAGVSFADEVNFGMARGMGSFGYALASYIIGYLTASKGSVIIPVFIMIASIGLMIVSIIMPSATASVNTDNLTHANSLQYEPNQESATPKESCSFLRAYPSFTFLWVVLIFMLVVHNLSNTYLLQILEKGGGDSHNLGIATAIAAIMEIPMIFFFEKISKKISIQKLLVIAAATYLLKSACQLFNSNLFVFYLIQFLQLTSWGVYASASVYYAKEMIPHEDQTKAQAYMANALTIATVFGTFIGGQLIEVFNVNVMLLFQTGVAIVSLIGMLIWKQKYYR